MRAPIALALLLAACSSAQDPGNDENLPSTGASGGSVDTTGNAGDFSGSGGGVVVGATGGMAGAAQGGTGGAGTGGKGGTSAQGGSNAAGSGVGGSNAAGSGGSGGGMHVAGPCSMLPAAGTWEKISPTGTTFTSAMAVDPFDSAVVWATSEFGLNKSTDCGATWKLVSTGANGPGLANSSLWSMVVDPVTQGTIYLVGGYGALSLWKSTNGGVDWTNLFPPGSEYVKVQQYDFVNNVSMDPTNHLHLATATHGTCAAPYAPNCDAETFDGGATWKLSVAPSGWPEGGGLFVLDAKTWLWCDPFAGIWRTEDNAATFLKVHTGYGGNGEFTNKPLVPASDGAYYLSSLQGILRSADGGKTWTQVKKDGEWVGFAMSSTTLYAADQWSNTFASAAISDPTKWTTFPPPSGLPGKQGAPFLAYDEDHHLLYASTWPNGLWRVVKP